MTEGGQVISSTIQPVGMPRPRERCSPQLKGKKEEKTLWNCKNEAVKEAGGWKCSGWLAGWLIIILSMAYYARKRERRGREKLGRLKKT